MLLSRVADQLFWGARHLERAECTARIVRTFTEVIVDLPLGLNLSWEPLLAISGSREAYDALHARAGEVDVIRFLVADQLNPSSVVSAVSASRENMRTVREVYPREGWQVANDLYLYTQSNGEAAVDRRSRNRVLSRVIAETQRIDGVMTSAMSRDEAYEMWRLGQSIERADMTTRVVGVRAAALLQLPPDAEDHDEVQWMGVLRSVSAMQMFQRWHRGPIDGESVVRFLVEDPSFPRSVNACLARIRRALDQLPPRPAVLAAADDLDAALGAHWLGGDDALALDAAMDALQLRLAALSSAVYDSFFAGA
ncbi:MAG: alpha-E domain-containing protein [Ilumatobacteraceae bacterium]